MRSKRSVQDKKAERNFFDDASMQGRGFYSYDYNNYLENVK